MNFQQFNSILERLYKISEKHFTDTYAIKCTYWKDDTIDVYSYYNNTKDTPFTFTEYIRYNPYKNKFEYWAEANTGWYYGYDWEFNNFETKNVELSERGI